MSMFEEMPVGVPSMPSRPFSKVPADEKPFFIERATDTLIEAGRIKAEMKKDKPFRAAVNKKLKEIAKAATEAKT